MRRDCLSLPDLPSCWVDAVDEVEGWPDGEVCSVSLEEVLGELVDVGTVGAQPVFGAVGMACVPATGGPSGVGVVAHGLESGAHSFDECRNAVAVPVWAE